MNQHEFTPDDVLDGMQMGIDLSHEVIHPAPVEVAAPARKPTSPSVRAALAGLIGNVLEWFDFAVYGYFATTIGNQFFPRSNPAAQQMLAFAVFAVGFFARPFGSAVLGVVGDRLGRRALMTLSIGLMGASTLALGLLPTYGQIGIAAPMLLIVMRLLQGFSLGGEFTGAMVYTTEASSPQKRGIVCSISVSGVTIGFILGSASAWLVSQSLAADQVARWGWRIPFVSSVFFCLAGWLLRRGLHETVEGIKARSTRPPLLSSLIADWLPILQTFGIGAMMNASYYLIYTFVVEQRKSTSANGAPFLLANTVTLISTLLMKPFGGWLSDRIGRRKLMLILTAMTVAVIVPAFRLMLYGAPLTFMFGQMLVAMPIGLGLGMQGAMIVEIFPLRTRVMSMSIAYSVMIALAGGTAPLLSAWLIRTTNQVMSPAYYVIALGFIGLAIMWPMEETNGRALDV